MTASVAQVREDYRHARDAYYAACERADAAFRRYFEKRVAGVPTNGAAVSRLENEANYRSAVLFQKQGDVYRLGYDPWDIDDDDGVPRSPLGYD